MCRTRRAVAMMMALLVARAIGRCDADANVTKMTPFPIGSPCYANYQCTKNVAFCEKAGGILSDTSTGDGEKVYAYRALEYKYRVEAECGLYGYDKENFVDNLAMNVARFANSVAKVMDVDARTVEVL